VQARTRGDATFEAAYVLQAQSPVANTSTHVLQTQLLPGVARTASAIKDSSFLLFFIDNNLKLCVRHAGKDHDVLRRRHTLPSSSSQTNTSRSPRNGLQQLSLRLRLLTVARFWVNLANQYHGEHLLLPASHYTFELVHAGIDRGDATIEATQQLW
jgi:hypothetical protein